MKQQVQETGVRKWFGDDFINLQNELIDAVTGLVLDYEMCILSGCVYTLNGDGTWTISDGIISIKDSIGAYKRICRFYAQTFAGATAKVYFVMAERDRTTVSSYGRQYKDGSTKNIIVEYYAVAQTSQPAHSNYFEYNKGGTTQTLRDSLQNSLYRFVTDAEKASWNGKLAASAYTAADVLAKLLTVDTDTAGINATTLKGAAPATGVTNSTIAQRDSSGVLSATDFRISGTALSDIFVALSLIHI